MTDEELIQTTKLRDERNRAWSALYQIKLAMPYLSELLEVMPERKTVIGQIDGPTPIKLAALIGATMDIITESGLPEDYTDESYSDALGSVSDTREVG